MPLSAADRLAIAEVIARYAHATDAGDGPGTAAVFTPDGILEIEGAWQARGHEQIAQIGAFPNKPKHWINSIVAEGTGSTASANVYYAAIRGGGPLGATGRYESQLTKQLDGQWKLVHHRYVGDPTGRPPTPRAQDERALSLEDRAAILELVARFNTAFDERDGEACADTFLGDGAYQRDDDPLYSGRDAIVRLVREEPGDLGRRWTTNYIIEGDAQAASMRCYFAVFSGNEVTETGMFHDDLRKVDGSWRFARRHLVRDVRAE